MSFDLNSISKALNEPDRTESGVDFTGKSLKLDSEQDARPIVDAINACPNLHYLTLTGNTLGVDAAKAIAVALSRHPELRVARFSDMFTGRMKTEIPLALSALGDGMIEAGARLTLLDLSDNAFGPIGVEGLAKLLQSEVCSELQELRLNNNGLGITGGRLLAKALSSNPLKLKVFVAGRNRLENDGARALAAVFQGMGSLEELAMPQNGIYHSGISALSESFRHSPKLEVINLNDNTIGRKGAAAIADALPSLKNLKSINFGDCLLKSFGASALAQAIKEHNVLLESVELNHNEIGQSACMELVDALTSQPGASERLTRVNLAGNSLGGAAKKKMMKEKLGAAAELSDGEGTDDDYESESGSLDESEVSEDSATEDARHADISVEEVLDNTGVEEVETDVGRFLKDPTVENFNRIGGDVAEVIDAHLQSIHDLDSRTASYVEAACCLWSVSDTDSCGRLCRAMVQRVTQQWVLANNMLKALQLIKSENKEYKIRWKVPSCYKALAREIDEPYFPHALRETLKFFITSKMATLPEEIKSVIEKHPNLFT